MSWALALAGTLCGCATGPGPHAVDRTRLADDRYAMAHGVALAFLGSGRATGMDLLQVIHLDRTALLALSAGSLSPAPSDALIDYVTRRELDGAPPPDTVPSEFTAGLKARHPPASPTATPAPPPNPSVPGS